MIGSGFFLLGKRATCPGIYLGKRASAVSKVHSHRTMGVSRTERMGGMARTPIRTSVRKTCRKSKAKKKKRSPFPARLFWKQSDGQRSSCKHGEDLISPCLPVNRHPSRQFTEEKFLHVRAQRHWVELPPQDTSLQAVYSYAVFNRGSHSAVVRVSVGPTRRDFVVDREVVVGAGEGVVMVPTRFLKYTRIFVRGQGGQTWVDIYFQSQSKN